jgi:hypothetical protein
MTNVSIMNYSHLKVKDVNTNFLKALAVNMQGQKKVHN